jgi:hypothetical protein
MGRSIRPGAFFGDKKFLSPTAQVPVTRGSSRCNWNLGGGGVEMKSDLPVALIAAAVALISAAGTMWSSLRNAKQSAKTTHDIALLQIEHERAKTGAQRQRELSKYSEPLARSAYELQSRLYNILVQSFVATFVTRGNERERGYAIDHTTFVFGQFLCWVELVRREVQLVDLEESTNTRKLVHLQDAVCATLSTDKHPRTLRIFAGEQRAIGEALIQDSARGPECMGYGAFLMGFAQGANPLIDAIRADVESLGKTGIEPVRARLRETQNALIDLLLTLDPQYVRFSRDQRAKA